MTPEQTKRVDEAKLILGALGLPPAQQNERSALCLLALLDMTPDRGWAEARNPSMGITPIRKWVQNHYGKIYAPDSRESLRRQSMHQFVDAGLALYNPDDPTRPVNSPKAIYQIEPTAHALIQNYGSKIWKKQLSSYLSHRPTLAEQYAMAREQSRIPIKITDGKIISLTPGEHSRLIRAIVEDFAPRFAPGAQLIYAGDTGEKMGYFDAAALSNLDVKLDSHGKMPDVVLHDPARDWLILVEAVTSHGPVDGKRHAELAKLFEQARAGLVFVTAFPHRRMMSRYTNAVAWETEVWVADAPSHLIHFDGERFLGPYPQKP